MTVPPCKTPASPCNLSVHPLIGARQPHFEVYGLRFAPATRPCSLRLKLIN
jgi:hypothetical protein